MSADLSIGNEIKDSFKETHKWVQNNLKWLKDIEQFYRERAKLEKTTARDYLAYQQSTLIRSLRPQFLSR